MLYFFVGIFIAALKEAGGRHKYFFRYIPINGNIHERPFEETRSEAARARTPAN